MGTKTGALRLSYFSKYGAFIKIFYLVTWLPFSAYVDLHRSMSIHEPIIRDETVSHSQNDVGFAAPVFVRG